MATTNNAQKLVQHPRSNRRSKAYETYCGNDI